MPTIDSKGRQRLFFLRLLNSFCVKSDILHLFYTSTIESIINYNITLWWAIDNIAINKICK